MHLRDLITSKTPEKGATPKLSQSRLYLMITFIATLAFIFLAAFFPGQLSSTSELLDTLFMILLLFSGYALGAKGLQHIERIKKGK